MGDYPDWTRLFQLAGTDITIPINIEASDVTLPVSIDAATALVKVEIAVVSAIIPIRITASTVTLDVNIESQDANIAFTFADQSVAVFDAAKWFAHEADQVFVSGTTTGTIGGTAAPCTRTVPAGKVFYICGFSYVNREGTVRNAIEAYIAIAGTTAIFTGSSRGAAVIIDVPLRATAGQVVTLTTEVYGGAGVYPVGGAFWGWDEED